MKEVKKQDCPSCGAPLRFDAGTGKLVCDYCGTTVSIDEAVPDDNAVVHEDGDISGVDFLSLEKGVLKQDAENIPIYNCNSCGAELIAPAEQAALTCPYCGNNIVLTDKVSGKLRPDGIIPFKIDAKTLPSAMRNYYKGKILLPKNFFSENTMSKVTGVYVPFWVFNGRVSGSLKFSGDKISTHREGDYEITETEHYSLDRKVSMNFENVPVDASGRIDDALMDSMEPFNMGDAVNYDMRYLAGYTADRFDQAREKMAERARNRMFATAEGVVRPKVEKGYLNVRRTGGSLKADMKAKYLLFPVYLFSLSFEGKEYDFAVNGQTGKVSGTLPIDHYMSRMYFFKRFLAVLAAVIAVFLGKYLLGR